MSRSKERRQDARGPGRRRLALFAVVSIVALAAGITSSAVRATDTVLPGGTALSVDIDQIDVGGALPQGLVQANGTAAIGGRTVEPEPIDLYSVLDVSGSTTDLGGCGGNPNNDAASDTVLDCEVASLIALNSAAIDRGSVDQVGAVAFGDTAGIADVSPASGQQSITTPETRPSPTGLPSLELVLRSARASADGSGLNGFQAFTPLDVGFRTNFQAAVNQVGILTSLGDASRPKIVAFVSDGVSTAGGPAVDLASALPANVDIHAFAVGEGGSCTDTGVGGSLEQIAEATGGTCTRVTSPKDLLTLVPGVIAPQLTSIVVTVDGGPSRLPRTNTKVPVSGPASVEWDISIPGLVPGSHTICAKALGVDSGGQGFAVECTQVNVPTPPDNDGDGTPDSSDPDDDNDGISDADELAAGSDPNSADSSPEVCDGADNDGDDSVDEGFTDTDADGQADCVDTDDDGDGTSDVDEAAGGSDPSDPNSSPEVCDGADNDADGSVDEGFIDTDGDGQADCVDADDDNDGASDADEDACGSDPLAGSSTCPTYVFTGFSAPVDNAPVLNVANAGRTVPLKYRLTTASGEPVSEPASFSRITSAKAPCGDLDDAGTDSLETYSGSSGLQYLGDGYWQINWATSKSYASTTNGPCRVLTVELSDGTTYKANFRFK